MDPSDQNHDLEGFIESLVEGDFVFVDPETGMIMEIGEVKNDRDAMEENDTYDAYDSDELTPEKVQDMVMHFVMYFAIVLVVCVALWFALRAMYEPFLRHRRGYAEAAQFAAQNAENGAGSADGPNTEEDGAL